MVFRCSIRNIIPGENYRFSIEHDRAIELEAIDEKWVGPTSAIMPLLRDQANNLKPGDYLIYSGTPRLEIHPSPISMVPPAAGPNIPFLLLPGQRYLVDLTNVRYQVKKAVSP